MTESEAKLMHTTERHLFQNTLQHLKTRQGRFDAAIWHLDHPIPGTDRYLDASDGGVGAAEIRNACEPKRLWFILWQIAYAKLRPNGKCILRALMVDWRSRPAAKIAGVSHVTVNSWKKIFKVHFAQCHTAWKRDFAK